MPTLTMEQIAGVILNMDDTNGPIAIAIAMAESGGDPGVGAARANSDGSHDWGLWQINDRAHPNLMSSYDWSDPDENWSMAYIVYTDAGNSWTPWSTYKNGTYRTYLLQAQRAWQNPDKSVSLENRTVQTTDTAQFVSALSDPQTWMRISLVIGGAIAVLIALWNMAGM